jgi:hypothetical protein
VIVAGVLDGTADARYENVPLVDPDEMVTSAGRLSAGCDADNVTSTCPAGAGAVRLTWPTPPWPPLSVVTFKVTDASEADVPFTVTGARSTVLS